MLIFFFLSPSTRIKNKKGSQYILVNCSKLFIWNTDEEICWIQFVFIYHLVNHRSYPILSEFACLCPCFTEFVNTVFIISPFCKWFLSWSTFLIQILIYAQFYAQCLPNIMHFCGNTHSYTLSLVGILWENPLIATICISVYKLILESQIMKMWLKIWNN